jgi:hypothetical protein
MRNDKRYLAGVKGGLNDRYQLFSGLWRGFTARVPSLEIFRTHPGCTRRLSVFQAHDRSTDFVFVWDSVWNGERFYMNG